jgi:hypothetical protein
MLRRQAVAGILSVLCGAAIGAPSRPSKVFEAFFRQFGEADRTYVLRESLLAHVKPQALHEQ